MHLLMTTHQMFTLLQLICHHLVNQPLLSMDRILACMNLPQSGPTPGHRHPMVPLGMGHREEVAFLNHMVTVDPLLTVAMLE